MDPFALILAAIGGQVAIIGLVAWLGRSLLSQVLAKELETFKSKLSQQAALSIEQSKHQLALKAAEHQVSFSRLHERRMELIADLYSQLVVATNAAQTYAAHDVPAGSSEWKERYSKTLDAVSALRDRAQSAKIYLPHAVSEQVIAYANRLHAEVIGLAIYTRVSDDKISEIARQSQFAQSQQADRFFRDKLPMALLALEDEFHSLVGNK